MSLLDMGKMSMGHSDPSDPPRGVKSTIRRNFGNLSNKVRFHLTLLLQLQFEFPGCLTLSTHQGEDAKGQSETPLELIPDENNS